MYRRISVLGNRFRLMRPHPLPCKNQYELCDLTRDVKNLEKNNNNKKHTKGIVEKYASCCCFHTTVSANK